MLLVPSNQRDPAIPKSPTVATRIGEPSLIKLDLHVHLYGCLSAEDLWLIGKDRYKKHAKINTKNDALQDRLLNHFC